MKRAIFLIIFVLCAAVLFAENDVIFVDDITPYNNIVELLLQTANKDYSDLVYYKNQLEKTNDYTVAMRLRKLVAEFEEKDKKNEEMLRFITSLPIKMSEKKPE